ncbi:MAG: tyrosine-type recombinase/integrase [Deltaproteobacteria bacterium]|jgi:integrase|nr:tyrosine-type recombinase/integrase [Deltaproteobacteria bacterium]
MTLTDKTVQGYKAGEKHVRHFDQGGLGLYLEVRRSGAKLWNVRFVRDGKYSTKALGAYPGISLKEAREKAAAFRKGLSENLPPPSSPPASEPFRDLARDWAANIVTGLSSKSRTKIAGLLRERILPAIGEMPVAEVTSRIILDRVLRPAEEEGLGDTVSRLKSVISQSLRYGVAEGRAERDVTPDLRGAMKPVHGGHRAAITDPLKVGEVLRAVDGYGGDPVTGYALRMLPYVFVRPGELRNAEWAEFDLDGGMWRIPAGRMKMKNPHVVPLATQVRELLYELQELTGTGRLLFPGRRSKDRPISDVTLTAGLRRMGFSTEEICPHGFRTTASTLLNEKGYPADWIERQLAHRERNGVRAAYNRAEHLQERARMMQEWADYLDSLKAPAKTP